MIPATVTPRHITFVNPFSFFFFPLTSALKNYLEAAMRDQKLL